MLIGSIHCKGLCSTRAPSRRLNVCNPFSAIYPFHTVFQSLLPHQLHVSLLASVLKADVHSLSPQPFKLHLRNNDLAQKHSVLQVLHMCTYTHIYNPKEHHMRTKRYHSNGSTLFLHLPFAQSWLISICGIKAIGCSIKKLSILRGEETAQAVLEPGLLLWPA